MKQFPLLVSVALGATVMEVSAQGTQPNAAGIVVLDEVVVTAQKRSENLQDVPIAVSAFSADQIAAAGFNDVGDIAQQVPSMSINTHFQYANPKIYLRGVGTNEYQANAVGAVAVYQDDVYLAASSGQLFQFFDLESVEILRGPQGTLYGKNTTGGAIKVNSRRPGNELDGNLSISAGNFGALDVEAGASLPLIDNVLAARVAVVSNSRDGYVRNDFLDSANVTRNDDKVNDRNSRAGRLILSYTPSEDLTVDLNVHTGENRSTSAQGQSFFLADTDANPVTPLNVLGFYRDYLPLIGVGTAQGQENPDKFVQGYNLDISESLDVSGASARIAYDFANMTLTSISATEEVGRNSREDVDQTPASILEIEWDNESEQFTQELQLASTGEGAFSWITGVYYFTDEITVANIYNLGRDFPAILGVTGVVTQDYVQDTDSLGAYLQGTYALTDRLNATLGIRYTDEEKQWTGTSRLTVPGGFVIPTLPQQTQEESWNATSWRVALDYSFTDYLLGYASVNRGHKAGGFNGGAVANQSELGPFDQEELTAYEVGLKSDLLDSRMRLNVAAFFYDYKDIQIFTIEPPQGGLPLPLQVIRNAESAENYGAEVEVVALLTSNFDVSVNAAYLNTEIGQYAPRPDIGLDYTGNRIGNSPEYDVSVAANYRIPVDTYELTLHADVAASAERWFDPSNTDRVYQGGYELWNASVTFGPQAATWAVSLWSKNLLDEEYTTEIIPIDGFFFDEHFAGVPRTYGVTFRYDF